MLMLKEDKLRIEQLDMKPVSFTFRRFLLAVQCFSLGPHQKRQWIWPTLGKLPAYKAHNIDYNMSVELP